MLRRTLCAAIIASLLTACSGVVSPDAAIDVASESATTDAIADVTSDVAVDAGPACGTSPADFESRFDRHCTGDSECTVAIHQTDCCGNQDAFGVNTGETRFGAAESACQATYPGCGCAAFGVTIEGSMTRVPSPTDVSAMCRSGQCIAVARVACGSTACAANQLCADGCCGAAGCTPPPSQCIDVPSSCGTRPTCSCFPSNPCPAGSCVEVRDGHVVCICG
jgi:hypothetical protein